MASESRNLAQQRREKDGIVYFERGILTGRDGRRYQRYAIQTHFVEVGESAAELVKKYVLPLAQPGIITVSIFNFLSVWNEYFIAMVFASSDRLKSVGYGLFSLVSAMKSTGNLGGLFAAVVIVFLPTFILYLFLSERIIAGVTGGGIKG